MTELIRWINMADGIYHRLDKPAMPDRDYDALWDELKSLETETGVILSGSPTQKPSGVTLDDFLKVEHERPMLSAAKTKQLPNILRFLNGCAAVVSWRMDGISLIFHYEDGILIRALTPGANGLIGEGVTHTVHILACMYSEGMDCPISAAVFTDKVVAKTLHATAQMFAKSC